MSAVPTGTAIGFPNLDTVRHHVYSFSPAKAFELKLYIGTPTESVLFYQPKYAFAAGDGLNVEALVRWVHPQRGFVPPMAFVPFAEQTGHIKTITLWVLERGVRQCAQWHRAGRRVSVGGNLSARDLVQAELPERFRAMLERHGCAADWITLEITESAVLDDPGKALANLDRLRATGCQLSIDDYGTGYSSLS